MTFRYNSQYIGSSDEYKLFSKRIEEYEDCIRFNKAEVEKLAHKYGWNEDFYFLPEKNNFFSNPVSGNCFFLLS